MQLPTLRQTGLATMQFILLAAVVLPAMVPTGYMVQRNAETNLVELTICSGVNHRQILLDLDTGAFHETNQAEFLQGETSTEIIETAPCPLAISAMALFQDPPVADEATTPTVYYIAGIVDLNVSAYQALPPARAPPLLSLSKIS